MNCSQSVGLLLIKRQRTTNIEVLDAIRSLENIVDREFKVYLYFVVKTKCKWLQDENLFHIWGHDTTHTDIDLELFGNAVSVWIVW